MKVLGVNFFLKHSVVPEMTFKGHTWSLTNHPSLLVRSLGLSIRDWKSEPHSFSDLKS